MDVTVKDRKLQLYNFMKNFSKEFNKTYKNGNFVYNREIKMFKTKKLSYGVEGVVYLAKFKKNQVFTDDVIIKVVNLLMLQETKEVKKRIVNMTPDMLYELFLTNKAFKEPSLIELISQTLTNQLVFQKICPNYTLNYYWEYEDTKNLNSYNEYINGGDFHSWAKEKHTDLEWFNALFQIMVGLLALKRYFNMLHTDFHTRNILVYKVKPGGYWKYKIDNKTYYLPNLGYIFLINDFGFAWIPNNIYMNWYYKQRLRYITKSGRHFYDISVFLKLIITNYNLPSLFKSAISKMFKKEEVTYVITKNYYQKYYKKSDPKLLKYPDISVNYSGLNTTLADKIYQIFYQSSEYNNTANFNLSKKIENSECIESYSLDKKFNISKLPKQFRKLVI